MNVAQASATSKNAILYVLEKQAYDALMKSFRLCLPLVLLLSVDVFADAGWTDKIESAPVASSEKAPETSTDLLECAFFVVVLPALHFIFDALVEPN